MIPSDVLLEGNLKNVVDVLQNSGLHKWFKMLCVGGSITISAARTIQTAILRTLAKKIETKQSNQTITDGTEVFHNNFVTLSSTLLYTSTGVTGPTTASTNNCIGDQINLQGFKIAMMVELNECHSHVTFRLLVVKAAKGDIPTRGTLFNGQSGNKMIDTINTE